MRFRHSSRLWLTLTAWLCLAAALSFAQPPAVDFGAAAGDANKLFELGQDFHERNQLAQALVCYDEALKLQPEFPEAAYQRASALSGLGRKAEAEKALRRASELAPEWPLPHIALGSLLTQLNRLPEAEAALDEAFKLDEKNPAALNALTELRLHPPVKRDALPPLLERLKAATAAPNVIASLWMSRAQVEIALEKREDALASLSRALDVNPRSLPARQQRAELLRDLGRLDEAIQEARALVTASNQALPATLFFTQLCLRAGRREAALQALDNLPKEARGKPEVIALYNSILLEGPVDAQTCAALEPLAGQQSGNAALLARLGACHRTDDPARSLEFYRRAAELEPRNPDYATGYAAALVQARKFPEAAAILRRVLTVAPDHQPARANLATALFEAKDFAGAVAEFEWLAENQPDNAVVFYFLAVTRDRLGEFPEALAAYEKFLGKASADANKDEIERVNLRLPSLKRQIKNGEGKKKPN
jgi:tetratricopeptide (TPR) repeat protein